MFDLADHLNTCPPWCDIIVSCIQSVTDQINNDLHVLLPVDKCAHMQLSIEKVSSVCEHKNISYSNHKTMMVNDSLCANTSTVSLLQKGY